MQGKLTAIIYHWAKAVEADDMLFTLVSTGILLCVVFLGLGAMR